MEENSPVKETRYKPCCKCKKSFPQTTKFFISNKSKPDGLDTYCAPCRRKYRNDRAEAEREKRRKAKAKIRKPPSAGEVVRGTEQLPEVSKKWFLQEAYTMYQEQVRLKNTTSALRCLELIAKVGNLGEEKTMNEKEMVRSLMEAARRGEAMHVLTGRGKSVEGEKTEGLGEA